MFQTRDEELRSESRNEISNPKPSHEASRHVLAKPILRINGQQDGTFRGQIGQRLARPRDREPGLDVRVSEELAREITLVLGRSGLLAN
jgi:hypothetical protein